MSLFSKLTMDCPACGLSGDHELVYSVNADRRPELRDEILDRTFQRLTCSSCAATFRVQPQFTYFHAAGHQFITAWPSTDLERWPERVARSEEAFDRLWGTRADPMAAKIGSELVRRVTFGWEAVHEKILAADAGISDETLELAKLALLRTQDDIPVADVSLRLMGVDEDTLVIGVVEATDEHVYEHFMVPRALLAEIETDPEAWAPLRERIADGPFVDMQRLVTAPAEA